MTTSSEPQDAEAVYARANALDDQGERDDALRVIEEGVALYPWYSRLWALRGHLLFQMLRFAEAEASFTRALDLKPALPFALFMRARAREELERPAEAAIDFLACLACQPSRADANLAVIRCLLACKELRSSARFLERASSLNLTDEERAELVRYRVDLEHLELELQAAVSEP
jgi:tetratricopeptide (TPR) repeat protein